MKKEFYKSVSFKLAILSVIIIISLATSSLIFNSKIDKLKTQIDYIYFGNYMPVLKLYSVEENYKDLITCMKIYKKCNRAPFFKTIKEDWTYYSKSYKNEKEQKVVDAINEHVLNSLTNKGKFSTYKKVASKIEFLKEYEKKIAKVQRKKFLKEYEEMRDYLFYNMVVLVFISFLLISLIIYSIIKKDNQLKILTKRYKLESITDAMTKLYNRKYFDNIFDNMPFISNANNWKSAFVMLDIDFFKQYNDTYGHDMGDVTLKEVANSLKTYFNKDYEYVFRLGGEEFGVILFDVDEDILAQCLQDVNDNIKGLNIEHKGSKVESVVTISIGAVIYNPNSYISGNKLYKQADDNLYTSKQSGRNQYTITEGEK